MLVVSENLYCHYLSRFFWACCHIGLGWRQSREYSASTFSRAQGVLRRNLRLDEMLGSCVKHLILIFCPSASQPCCASSSVSIILRVIPWSGSLSFVFVIVSGCPGFSWWYWQGSADQPGLDLAWDAYSDLFRKEALCFKNRGHGHCNDCRGKAGRLQTFWNNHELISTSLYQMPNTVSKACWNGILSIVTLTQMLLYHSGQTTVFRRVYLKTVVCPWLFENLPFRR